MTDAIRADQPVDMENRLIDPVIFTDPEVYALEQEQVFGRTWLYVGHETQIPNPGDYIGSFMGEVAVIVVRGKEGQIRVLRNQCLHRGNKVCLFDRGNAKSFTCTFHGWQYNTAGELVGVPHFKDAYKEALARDKWGLEEAPRVETYSGLILASWDANIPPLADYLGDVAWYLDRTFLVEQLGGLEVVGGQQRYLMPANWKQLAENFQGDEYHVQVTHASYFKVLMEDTKSFRKVGDIVDRPQVGINYWSGVPHGLGAFEIGDRPHLYERDLATAEDVSPEAVEWVKKRTRLITERLADDPVAVHGFSNGNIFPNLSLLNLPNAFQARSILVWQPKGPMLTELWAWALVEREAPRSVKEIAVRNLMMGQAAAGMIAPDDSENFERSTDNLLSQPSADHPFTYEMGEDEDEELWKRMEEQGVDVSALPGVVGPYNWEGNSRAFYRYWSELMGDAVE